MMAEFWGVEVKSGEPLVVECGVDFAVHLSQACLGEVKKDKGNEPVLLSVKIADKKIVLGTLSSEKFPQLSFDVVFDQDFELSHNWKHGSVYFIGYKLLSNNDDESESEPEGMQDLPVATNNVKPGTETTRAQLLTGKAKPDSTGQKQKVKIVEPNKDDKSGEETDDSSADEGDSSDEDDSSDDKDMKNDEDDESDEDEDDESDDESDESDDEDEETPRMLKIEQDKKRSAEPAKNTPLPVKKAKLVTPQKTDGKKASSHVPTPHPSKKIVKTPASSDQKKEQSQKSFPCTSCNRSFGSEMALQSHSKAKHSAA